MEKEASSTEALIGAALIREASIRITDRVAFNQGSFDQDNGQGNY